MKRMLKDWGLALLIAAAVFFVIQLFPGGGPELPDEAPALHLPLLDGGDFDLDAYRGRTVVLNFWATWCGPCRQEIPEFAAFAREHPEVALIGVAVDSGDAAEIRRTAKKWGIAWPVAIGDGSTSRAYDVSVLPTTVIIGPDGKVRSATAGTMSQSQLARAIR